MKILLKEIESDVQPDVSRLDLVRFAFWLGIGMDMMKPDSRPHMPKQMPKDILEEITKYFYKMFEKLGMRWKDSLNWESRESIRDAHLNIEFRIMQALNSEIRSWHEVGSLFPILMFSNEEKRCRSEYPKEIAMYSDTNFLLNQIRKKLIDCKVSITQTKNIMNRLNESVKEDKSTQERFDIIFDTLGIVENLAKNADSAF